MWPQPDFVQVFVNKYSFRVMSELLHRRRGKETTTSQINHWLNEEIWTYCACGTHLSWTISHFLWWSFDDKLSMHNRKQFISLYWIQRRAHQSSCSVFRWHCKMQTKWENHKYACLFSIDDFTFVTVVISKTVIITSRAQRLSYSSHTEPD